MAEVQYSIGADQEVKLKELGEKITFFQNQKEAG